MPIPFCSVHFDADRGIGLARYGRASYDLEQPPYFGLANVAEISFNEAPSHLGDQGMVRVDGEDWRHMTPEEIRELKRRLKAMRDAGLLPLTDQWVG